MPQGHDKRFSLITKGIVWVMVVLMTVPGNLDYTFTADSLEANPTTRAFWLAILVISLLVLLSKLSLTLRLLRQTNVFYLAFIALAIASFAWSIDPELTLRRLARLLTMFSAFLAIGVAAWNPRRFQQLVRPILTLLLLGSIIFGLTYPDLAIHQETSSELLNAWRGLASQKNELGALASFGLILSIHAWLAKEVRLPRALFELGTAGACLILSRSSTSIMGTVFSVFFLMLLMRAPGSMRRTMPYLVAALTITIFAYAMAMLKLVPGLDFILAPIPMITGKDLTFSGRAEIWAAIVDHIQLRPFLGGGYGAYWAGPQANSESQYLIAILHGFYPASAHNGYLDVLNDLGAVGMLCLAGYLVVYVAQSLRLYSIDRIQGSLFLGLFLQQAVTNLSESHWLAVNSLCFVLFSFATTCLARALLEARTWSGAATRRVPAGSRTGPRVYAQRPSGQRGIPSGR